MCSSNVKSHFKWQRGEMNRVLMLRMGGRHKVHDVQTLKVLVFRGENEVHFLGFNQSNSLPREMAVCGKVE